MRKLYIFLAAVQCVIAAYSNTFSFNFNSVRLSDALAHIAEKHPELHINFIYNELDNYNVIANIHTDNAYTALRQVVGLNPVSIIKRGERYYLEALQHGKFIYTGHAVGSDGVPICAATVLLLAPKDSTVITYGMTDETGRFAIPCDRRGVIARFSCLGFQSKYKKFDSDSVGTVVMTEMPIRLRGVNVKADYSLTTTDKTVYRPTSRQKNASQTAVDLLRNLAIPQININLVDESISTTDGSPVAVYVNGFPASADELQGMRTADVRTVELIDFPTDPRFNGNEHVINFIMQKYEYGGYTKLSANENVLVGLSSRTSLYSKFSYRRMIYDFYVGASNHDIHHAGTSRTGNYTLSDVDGGVGTVTRSEESDYSHFKYNQYPVTLRAIYDCDKVQIGNTVGFNFDQSPVAETAGNLSYNPAIEKNCTYSIIQPYTTRHFIWSGAYYFILPAGFQLNFSPKVNYGHTNYSYLYSASLPENSLTDNISRENYYQISGTASLYKVFSDRHNVLANVYGGTNKNEVKYSGATSSDNDFSDSYAGLRIGYNFNNGKWRFDSNIALQWEQNGINGNYISEIYPLINVSGRYSPSKHHSVQAVFHYGANYPGESVKTPNILQDNELMYKTGNPNLSLSRQISLNLQYNWIASNKFSVSLYGQYFGEYNLYVPVFESYRDGRAILKTYSSDQDYNRTQIGMSFNYKLFDGNLQFAAQPSVSIFRYNGYYKMSKNPFAVNSSITYYLNHFFFQASYQTAIRTIQGNLAVWYKNRDFYQLQAGWGNSIWNIRLSAINMFRGDWLAATQTLNSPLYSEFMLQGGTYFHRRLNFSVTYTFGYGKKVSRGNEVGEQSGGVSAILK